MGAGSTTSGRSAALPAASGPTARGVLARYPLLREDHLRCLGRWGLIRPAGRRGGRAGFSFADLAVIRRVHAELERGTAFRAVLRSLRAASGGQLAFDFRAEARPARVLVLARPPAPGRERRDGAGESAEEYFLAAAALDDGDPGKLAAAARAYRRALEIDPALAPAMINLANIHYAQDHLPEAEALYERAIASDPGIFEAHFNLGNVHHDLGRLDQARAAYEEALRLNPAYAQAHLYLAVTLEKLGRPRQARAHWRRYLELEPGGEWAQLAREFCE